MATLLLGLQGNPWTSFFHTPTTKNLHSHSYSHHHHPRRTSSQRPVSLNLVGIVSIALGSSKTKMGLIPSPPGGACCCCCCSSSRNVYVHGHMVSRSMLYRKCLPSASNSRNPQTARLAPKCVPEIWKHHRWVVDVAEFWGILGTPNANVNEREGIISAAVPGDGGQVELSDGANNNNNNNTRVLNVSSPNSDSLFDDESRSSSIGGDDDDDSDIGSELGSESRRDVVESALIGEEIEGEEIEEDLSTGDDDSGEVAMAMAMAATQKLQEASDDANWEFAEDNSWTTSSSNGSSSSMWLEDAGFRRQVAMAAADAGAALTMIADRAAVADGVVGNQECCNLIREALGQGNAQLAFSILDAMRSSLVQRRVDRDHESGASNQSWRWALPNVNTYATLVRGLAASLRVSDAIEIVESVRRRGVPAGDEVPFGKVVSCPTCKTSLAVVQPQQGVQVAPCANCRYQYELMSGTVVNCESESISMNISAFERGLRVLKLLKSSVPAAVHSLVVRAPNGVARTHRCATESADIPAQEGERVTIVSAAPANVGRGFFGPLKSSTRTPGWRPSEPMAITNHVTGRVSPLLRPPPKSGSGAAFDTSFIIPAVLLLASSDAATAFIDPALPRAIAVGAAAAIAVGGATNTFVLPRLNQLPRRTVDALALQQQLLAQHEDLQARLQNLTQAAADDVRMLARMCQLQNKIEAVGEPAYSARIERVQKAQKGLDERLEARLELIDSYAKIASMIEIEVEMDIDVLAAEGAGAAAIAEQIERLMEVEDLQKAWRFQAEANDEVERLLRSAPPLNESG